MATVPNVIYPNIHGAPANSVILRIMHRRGDDPLRDQWGDRLVEWKRSLLGGSDPAFTTELTAYRQGCVGSPSDYGLCHE